MGSFGISTGAHRLWAHKSFKATLPMQYMMLVFQTIALQNSVIEWVRDHRVHHKFSDTDADPHNSQRGFFFSHMGWLMCKKHPDVAKFGSKIDMSDLTSVPMLALQHKYYCEFLISCNTFQWHNLIFFRYYQWIVVPISFGLPVAISVFMFKEVPYYAACANIFRYMISLHFTWCTNSFSHHIGGTKPFEKYSKFISTRYATWIFYAFAYWFLGISIHGTHIGSESLHLARDGTTIT